MKPLLHAAVLCLALLLGACSTPLSHVYTLTPAGGLDTLDLPEDPPASSAYLLKVEPVGLPTLVNRQEVVVWQDSGIAVLPQERWSGMLGDELRDALSAQLQQRLATRDVSGLAIAPERPILDVRMMVRDFQSAPDYYVLFDADWSLTRSDEPRLMNPVCHSRFSVSPTQRGVAGLIPAHQQVLAAVSAQIADTARRWMLSGEVVCPRPESA